MKPPFVQSLIGLGRGHPSPLPFSLRMPLYKTGKRRFPYNISHIYDICLDELHTFSQYIIMGSFYPAWNLSRGRAMVLILDGNSLHVAHAGLKIGNFILKIFDL